MAKRRKQKNKKLPPKIEKLGNNTVQKVTIEKPKETIEHKSKKLKKIEKLSDEKVKAAPQTFTEDIFDLDNQSSSAKVIDNAVNKKIKKMITKDKLYELYSFKNKINKIKSRVEYEKNFDFLLDFVNATKLYRTYHIDEKIDEYDILLYEIVIHFKKRLGRIDLPYKVYKEVEDYFENLKTLYGDFKNAELIEKDNLNNRLEILKSKSDFISHYLF